ncbi:UNVERIFIED_CONTAM: Dehydration-responsive element-binding protein 1F [Sesamum radiatum]|uniref:Dehydration-responsive element-binding protein 1F n=1 Tax=Sesamum radiatum TaxID=300843 RepID=A0AAW2UJS2_SESRA
MGVRSPRAQQEIKNMARDISRPGDGSHRARRGGTSTAWRERASQLPGLCPSLPRAPSSSHQDIQRAALEAAMSSGGKPLLGIHRQAFDQTRAVSAENETERTSEGADSGGVGFVDEEAMFNLPVLLDSLAEGLLLTPLAMSEGFSWSHDEADDDVELNLWA